MATNTRTAGQRDSQSGASTVLAHPSNTDASTVSMHTINTDRQTRGDFQRPYVWSPPPRGASAETDSDVIVEEEISLNSSNFPALLSGRPRHREDRHASSSSLSIQSSSSTESARNGNDSVASLSDRESVGPTSDSSASRERESPFVAISDAPRVVVVPESQANVVLLSSAASHSDTSITGRTGMFSFPQSSSILSSACRPNGLNTTQPTTCRPVSGVFSSQSSTSRPGTELNSNQLAACIPNSGLNTTASCTTRPASCTTRPVTGLFAWSRQGDTGTTVASSSLQGGAHSGSNTSHSADNSNSECDANCQVCSRFDNTRLAQLTRSHGGDNFTRLRQHQRNTIGNHERSAFSRHVWAPRVLPSFQRNIMQDINQVESLQDLSSNQLNQLRRQNLNDALGSGASNSEQERLGQNRSSQNSNLPTASNEGDEHIQNFATITARIEREMDELDRRISALRNTFNESVRRLQMSRPDLLQQRETYSGDPATLTGQGETPPVIRLSRCNYLSRSLADGASNSSRIEQGKGFRFFLPPDRMIGGILFLSCLFVCLLSTLTFAITFER